MKEKLNNEELMNNTNQLQKEKLNNYDENETYYFMSFLCNDVYRQFTNYGVQYVRIPNLTWNEVQEYIEFYSTLKNIDIEENNNKEIVSELTIIPEEKCELSWYLSKEKYNDISDDNPSVNLRGLLYGVSYDDTYERFKKYGKKSRY